MVVSVAVLDVVGSVGSDAVLAGVHAATARATPITRAVDRWCVERPEVTALLGSRSDYALGGENRDNSVTRDNSEACPDEEETDQLGDVQHLDDTGAGESSADSWQKGADRDVDVAQHARGGVSDLPILPRRPERPPDEKDEGVHVGKR